HPEDGLAAAAAGAKPRACARPIAHTADHEQVSDRRARKPRDVRGFTDNETTGKAPKRARGSGDARVRAFDLFGERRVDGQVPLAGKIEKTHGELGVVSRERAVDL